MSEAKCTVPGDVDDGVVLQVGECLAKDLQYSKGRKRKHFKTAVVDFTARDYR